MIDFCPKLTSPFIFIALANLVRLVTGQYKCEGGNYTANSTFRANLDALLSALPADIPENGFHNASSGRGRDVVHAISLCRGDVRQETCRACVRNTTVELLNFCPTQNQAYLWREFCMLRYSNESIFSVLANYPSFWAWDWDNATMLEEFKANVRGLLDRLRVRAASGGPEKKVAAGNLTGPDFQDVYALVQCTPDLSALDCSTCLHGAAQDLPRCCDWRRGGGIFRPSCSLRYATYQFYNRSMLQAEEDSPLQPAPPPAPAARNKDGNDLTRRVTIIVVPISGCLVVAIGIYIFLRKRIRRKPNQEIEVCPPESLQYDFSTIREATNDFSEDAKLGQGGFGTVYKGKLPNGQEVAVKRLTRNSEQGDQEFKNEVMLVARLQHRNLVRLLGFSLKESERILVFEFVQNASLDHFIFEPIKRQSMNWDTRYKVIKGIAKGLVYLHEDSRLKIIHRDLKAGNVLLDGEMNPKIADFGLARLVAQDGTHSSTSRVAGTYGYMPPEYAFQGHFSVKSDVFSFGVIVLEIVSGQKNGNFRDEHQNFEHLLSYAWRNWQDGNAESTIDPVLRGGSCFPAEMMKCLHIGLLCVQENAGDRPTMASVLHMLNSSSQILLSPSKPGFFMQGRLDHAELINQSPPSVNEMSVTLPHPR